MFKLAADPKRWISVTAPPWPSSPLSPTIQQMARNHALHHLQHRRDQLGLRGQQQTQRDGQREHPLAHRHVRNDVIDQVGGGLRHAPGTA